MWACICLWPYASPPIPFNGLAENPTAGIIKIYNKKHRCWSLWKQMTEKSPSSK